MAIRMTRRDRIALHNNARDERWQTRRSQRSEGTCPCEATTPAVLYERGEERM